jgi:predicted RNA binding protein YcfA (HicA-like mRNA interferase family)
VRAFAAAKARKVLRALERLGWAVKRKGRHAILARAGWPDYPWGFHDREEIGRPALKKLAERTGLTPEDV